MGSIPVLKDLSSDDINKYNIFVEDINNFTLSYNNYINACVANSTCDGIDSADVESKLKSFGVNPDGSLDQSGSLANYKQIVDKNLPKGNTFDLNNQLLEKRIELKNEVQILTDVNNSIEGDNITKMKATFYTNILLYVGLGCVMYYSFHQITSSK
jgi:hypothetical protein